ncbi:conserved hypothetical protein [Magnetospirillum sp. LM-5]|nr:conserved hypothetical protein [Magnetospirillum sp. LM-5]
MKHACRSAAKRALFRPSRPSCLIGGRRTDARGADGGVRIGGDGGAGMGEFRLGRCRRRAGGALVRGLPRGVAVGSRRQCRPQLRVHRQGPPRRRHPRRPDQAARQADDGLQAQASRG